MDALESVLTFLGSSLCHQLEGRSYHIDGFQMPLCARCLGLHLGFLITGLLIISWRGDRLSGLPSIRSLIVLGVVMLPAMVDVVLSYAGVLDTDNTRRAVTGAMFGAALAFILVPFIRSLLPGDATKAMNLGRPFHWVMLVAGFSVAASLSLLSESYDGLFYAVAVAGIIGVFATMFSLILLLVLLLSERSPWPSRAKVALSAVAAPLALILLALLHGAVLD